MTRFGSCQFFQNPFQDWEYLHITVVIDRWLVIRFKMEGIDEVEIANICCGCFVSHVYRMLQGQIPNREGLKLGKSR